MNLESMNAETEPDSTAISVGPTHVPPILQLPDEILVSILRLLDLYEAGDSHFDALTRGGVRPELCAVALTCKKLARLAPEILLREVGLATGDASSSDHTYSLDRLRSFARTCNEKPYYSSRIQSLQMQCDFPATPYWGTTSDNLLPDTVLQVVSRSSTLENLRIVLSAACHIQWLPQLLIGGFDDSIFRSLRSLFLSCGDSPIPSSMLLRMLWIPALKTIEIDSPVGWWNVALDLLIAGPFQPPAYPYSNVVEICHNDEMSSSTALQQLLSWTPMLYRLSTTLSGIGLVFDDYDHPHHHHLSNSITQIAFSPVQQQVLHTSTMRTLSYLSLHSRQALIYSHDGTLLDLSRFRRLSFLQTSIHHICPVGLRNATKLAQTDPKICTPHTGFCDLLPKNLQTLVIDYDSDQGIFCDSHHLCTALYIEADPAALSYDLPRDQILPTMYTELWTNRISKLDGKDGVRDRLSWLSKLGALRDTRFPYLREVSVRETYARTWTWTDFNLVGDTPWSEGLFEPEDLDEVMAEKLKVSVIIRLLIGFEPPSLVEGEGEAEKSEE